MLSICVTSLFTSDPAPLLYLSLSNHSPVHSVATPVLPSAPVSLEETTDDFDTRYNLGVVCNTVLSKAQVFNTHDDNNDQEKSV